MEFKTKRCVGFDYGADSGPRMLLRPTGTGCLYAVHFILVSNPLLSFFCTHSQVLMSPYRYSFSSMREFITIFTALVHACVDISVYITTELASARIKPKDETDYIKTDILPRLRMRELLQWQKTQIDLLEKCTITNQCIKFVDDFMSAYEMATENSQFKKHHIPYMKRVVGWVHGNLDAICQHEARD
jgi:hypothetical protein